MQITYHKRLKPYKWTSNFNVARKIIDVYFWSPEGTLIVTSAANSINDLYTVVRSKINELIQDIDLQITIKLNELQHISSEKPFQDTLAAHNLNLEFLELCENRDGLNRLIKTVNR